MSERQRCYRRPVTVRIDDEAERAASLLAAQSGAAGLFAAIETGGILAPGVLESTASNAIKKLAAEQLGVTRHWHKRVVRSGLNTLQPYRENPPDRAIEADDIVFLDLGPIFEEWEADFGRTFVLGNDPVKHRLCNDLPILFDAGRDHFEAHPDITGAELFDHVVGRAQDRGWTWGGTIAGHVLGQFPHDEPAGDHLFALVAPGNDRPMRSLDAEGRECHWILEIHIVDLDRQIGGFYEELLDVSL
jgi:Xaa-Pro aminopeptidase